MGSQRRYTNVPEGDGMSMRESIPQACEVLFEPGQTTEVKLLGKRATGSGYFHDVEKLCSSVIPHENQGISQESISR